jgi:hypothetical protein
VDSSALHTLLRSVVQQLATVYSRGAEVDAKSSSGDVDALTKEFVRWWAAPVNFEGPFQTPVAFEGPFSRPCCI